MHDVERRYPTEHYFMVDDKLRLLTAIKEILGKKVTTVFPRQGHYAFDEKEIAKYPAAEIKIEKLGNMMNFNVKILL